MRSTRPDTLDARQVILQPLQLHHPGRASQSRPASAWSRSAIRSSTCSMPTDRRTSEGVMARGESATLACVMTAGSSIKRFHAAQRFGQSEQPRVLAQLPGGRLAAPQFDVEHAAEDGHLPAGQLMLRVRGQAGIKHAGDGRMPLKVLRDGQGVGRVRLHAQCQRLDAAQGQPAIHRSRHRAHAVLQERQAFVQGRIAHHDRPAHHVVVPAQVLGGRMYDDVGAQRPAAAVHREWRRCCRRTPGYRGDAPAQRWRRCRPAPTAGWWASRARSGAS